MAAYMGLSARLIEAARSGAGEAGAGEASAGAGSPTGRAGGAGPPPLVLLHGFTQSGASWAPVVATLAGVAPAAMSSWPSR